MAALFSRKTHWVCDKCTVEDETTESRPHSRMHACPAMLGLVVPLVPAGTSCRVRAVAGDEPGSIVGIQTEYADGHTDFAAYAGHGTVAGEGLGT